MGSKNSMAFPIKIIGWGRKKGSPNIKSKAKAKNIIYHSMGFNLPEPGGLYVQAFHSDLLF